MPQFVALLLLLVSPLCTASLRNSRPHASSAKKIEHAEPSKHEPKKAAHSEPAKHSSKKPAHSAGADKLASAVQLVSSVYALEDKAKLQQVEKPRLNGTDDTAFLKQYAGNATVRETGAAAVLAESYGEVSLEGLAKMLQTPALYAPAAAAAASVKKTGANPPKTFVDLGSGIGRCVLLACAMSSTFESCEGVELSEARHKMAVDALSKFKHLQPGAAKRVHFVHADLLADDEFFKKDVMLSDNRYLSDAASEEMVRKFERVAHRDAVLITTKELHQLPPRIATRVRMSVSGHGTNKEKFFKYTKTR